MVCVARIADANAVIRVEDRGKCSTGGVAACGGREFRPCHIAIKGQNLAGGGAYSQVGYGVFALHAAVNLAIWGIANISESKFSH